MDAKKSKEINQILASLGKTINSGNNLVTKWRKIPVENSDQINALYPEKENIIGFLKLNLSQLIAKISSEENLRRNYFEKLTNLYNALEELKEKNVDLETMQKLSNILLRITAQHKLIARYLEVAGV